MRHPIHTAKAAASVDRSAAATTRSSDRFSDRPVEFPAFNVHPQERRGGRFASTSTRSAGCSRTRSRRSMALASLPRARGSRSPVAVSIPLLVTARAARSLEWIARTRRPVTYPRPLPGARSGDPGWRRRRPAKAGESRRSCNRSTSDLSRHPAPCRSRSTSLAVRRDRSWKLLHGVLRNLQRDHAVLTSSTACGRSPSARRGRRVHPAEFPAQPPPLSRMQIDAATAGNRLTPSKGATHAIRPHRSRTRRSAHTRRAISDVVYLAIDQSSTCRAAISLQSSPSTRRRT